MDRKMLRFVEKRGIRTDQTPPARTEVLPARGEESKPVAHPCRGLGGHKAAVTFFEAEPLKNTHNYVLVEFVASAHARRYPRHIALSFVADLATQPNIDVVWVIIRFSQNLHNSLRVSDYARKTLVP